ncbi:MAG: hypothetical protein LBK55_04250 [Azoarcus sp.]|nr:hypothetical protein [Azoarcus sp.]
MEVILKGRKKESYSFYDIREPFLFVLYSPRRRGGVGIYLSSDVQEIAFSNLDAGSQADVPHKITAYRRLLGYGNHYFNTTAFSFARECCDNRDQGEKDYMEKKQEAYDHAIEDFRKMATIEDYPPKFYAIVSNCGDILRTGRGYIRSLGSNFEDGDTP